MSDYCEALKREQAETELRWQTQVPKELSRTDYIRRKLPAYEKALLANETALAQLDAIAMLAPLPQRRSGMTPDDVIEAARQQGLTAKAAIEACLLPVTVAPSLPVAREREEKADAASAPRLSSATLLYYEFDFAVLANQNVMLPTATEEKKEVHHIPASEQAEPSATLGKITLKKASEGLYYAVTAYDGETYRGLISNAELREAQLFYSVSDARTPQRLRPHELEQVKEIIAHKKHAPSFEEAWEAFWQHCGMLGISQHEFNITALKQAYITHSKQYNQDFNPYGFNVMDLLAIPRDDQGTISAEFKADCQKERQSLSRLLEEKAEKDWAILVKGSENEAELRATLAQVRQRKARIFEQMVDPPIKQHVFILSRLLLQLLTHYLYVKIHEI